MNERVRNIPCSDCAEWKKDLEMTGYRVLGCEQALSSPGMCKLRYTGDQLLDGSAALALAGAPVTLAALPAHADTDVAKKAAEAIVNIFETGSVLGDYSAVTLINHDSGHLTYGRSQTTLGSGNLYRLIQLYCENAGAVFARRLRAYLPRLKERDNELDNDVLLKNLLRSAADDPVMREVQDKFFDVHYWQPAVMEAAKRGIQTALGRAVVYDSVVHGSWAPLCERTDTVAGAITGIGESAWISAYLQTRRAWMAEHVRPDIRKTVYRMDALLSLATQGAWDLALPLVVRGREISAVTLDGVPDGCFDGPAPGSRDLAIQEPLLRGTDVRRLQLVLGSPAVNVVADGVFGAATAAAIKTLQRDKGFAQTGVADKALVAQLAAAAV